MPNVFLISDTHFGHPNMYKFVTDEGAPVRPWDNHEEADEAMIDNWNRVVRPKDKVYHLGDVYIKKQGRAVLARLNGRKVLIKGNHDIFKPKLYLEDFYDIRAYHVLDRMVLSHVPIHPSSMERFRGNVHGHLHNRVVLDSGQVTDPRYLSVCVERTNYTPVELSEVVGFFL